ncbi:MAG TPA: hypothetical protein VI636_07230 [Candidatus Angelobacter sp.]
MGWMPVVSEDNAKGGDIFIGVIIAVGTAFMIVAGIPWIRSFLYCVPAAVVIALGLRYWYKRHPVDLIQLGYKDYPKT